MKATKHIEEWQVLDAIRARTQASSQRVVAAEVGIKATYLSDILLGRRAISDRVAALFGFSRHVETVVFYKVLVTKDSQKREVPGG